MMKYFRETEYEQSIGYIVLGPLARACSFLGSNISQSRTADGQGVLARVPFIKGDSRDYPQCGSGAAGDSPW